MEHNSPDLVKIERILSLYINLTNNGHIIHSLYMNS
jgi:hypothetical protein